jgi:hypothetical protein
METIDSKLERLRVLLTEMGGVVIGYSGGGGEEIHGRQKAEKTS